MLLNGWIAQAEHRAWEQRFNVRAARGDFVRETRTRRVHRNWIQVPTFISRIRLGLQRLQRVQGQA